jgi:hypothetical protein
MRLLPPIALLLITACSAQKATDVAVDFEPTAADPLQATYSLDGLEVTLRDGRFDAPAAPESSARTTVTVFGRPVYGDLDDDQDRDAALILVYQSGGSGTFYYLAAAIGEERGYRGTNAVLLGDRIAPKALHIQYRSIVAEFLDREASQAFSATPTVAVSRYGYLDGHRLVELAGDRIRSGWFTFGHEVRSYLPCGDAGELWVVGQSPALSEIRSTYSGLSHGAHNYAPLFMILAGQVVDPPAEGFGAGYDGGFLAERVLAVKPSGNCRDAFITVDTPTPGAVIESPLTIRGRARGSWFFEGDFPVLLRNADGEVIARSFVTATEEWMTPAFVAFSGRLSFTKPKRGSRGTLVLVKDNPSDRAELDDSTAIPVFFAN